MKLSEIQSKIKSMVESEYFEKNDLKFIETEISIFIDNIDNHFGDNDGERLDVDSLEFLFTLLRLRTLENLGEYEDED